MTAPPAVAQSESSSRKSRRSRSPENRDLLSPSSARRRSEDGDSAVVRKKKIEFVVPSYLQYSVPEIQRKHMTLQEQDVARLRESVSEDSEWYIESDLVVRLRNRYSNIQPWAKNRIHLLVPPDKCDYINASPIVLHSRLDNRPHHYIATQGPKENQVSHFWRMVWSSTSDPAVVVMLTQCWEAGRDKCHPYFPDSPTSAPTIPLTEDDLGDGFAGEVTLLSSTYNSSCKSTIRELRLTVGGKSKTVWHFLYGVWPDFEVPEGDDRAALQALIHLSASKAKPLAPAPLPTDDSLTPGPLPLLPPASIPTPSNNSLPLSVPSPINPRIVHCSAGVGRSGTFIALDYLLSELSDGSLRDLGADTSPIDSAADPVFDAVVELRRQRMMMVQSDAQLVFLYQALEGAWRERYRGEEGKDVGKDVVDSAEGVGVGPIDEGKKVS